MDRPRPSPGPGRTWSPWARWRAASWTPSRPRRTRTRPLLRVGRARPARRRDRLPSRLPADGGARVRALRAGGDVAPAGRARLAGPGAARRQVRALLSLRAGGVRPALPGVDDRLRPRACCAGTGATELRARYLPRLTATDLDALGQGTQWMTERTGGSDVGAATTVARRDADGTWRLYGDKWFCSNANADMALTLARPEGAPAGHARARHVPRAALLPDGTRNALDHQPAEGQARLALDGDRRGDLRRRRRLSGRRPRPRLQADDGDGQRLPALQRDARRRHHAPRLLESLMHARGRAAFGRPLAELPLLRAQLVRDARSTPRPPPPWCCTAPARSTGADAGRRRGRALCPHPHAAGEVLDHPARARSSPARR